MSHESLACTGFETKQQRDQAARTCPDQTAQGVVETDTSQAQANEDREQTMVILHKSWRKVMSLPDMSEGCILVWDEWFTGFRIIDTETQAGTQPYINPQAARRAYAQGNTASITRMKREMAQAQAGNTGTKGAQQATQGSQRRRIAVLSKPRGVYEDVPMYMRGRQGDHVTLHDACCMIQKEKCPQLTTSGVVEAGAESGRKNIRPFSFLILLRGIVR
jgi:hypothetical protein